MVPDGFRKGEWFRLYDYQFEYLANFYLVRGDVEFDAEAPVLGPAFVFRRGVLIGPQKLGKGPGTAAHVCLEGLGPALFAGWAGRGDGYACSAHGCSCGWEYAYAVGEPMGMRWPTPLIQITATSADQVGNVYEVLKPMITEGPLGALARVGEDFTRLPNGGRIDVVSSSATSRLGQRITHAAQDEVGLWTPFNKMTKVAQTQFRGLAGMGGRASLTSNAWDPSERSVAQAEFESDATDVYRQFVQPSRALSFANRRDRRKILRVVYPRDTLRENGGHVDLDAIEAEAADLFGKDPAQAARFFGNILVAGAGAAVDPGLWERAARPGRAVVDGERIGLGFDGSISDDTTALIACTADGHLFVPTVDGRPTVWVRPANVPDWRVPRLEVEDAVADVMSRYRVGRMLCDPPKWSTEIERWMETYNRGDVADATVMFFDTNQGRRMAVACDRFTTDLANGALSHDAHPVLDSHVLAMVKKKAHLRADESDGRTLYVFTKGDEGRKIDAGVGAVLAVQAAMTMPELVLLGAPGVVVL